MKRRKFILCLVGTTAAGLAGWKWNPLRDVSKYSSQNSNWIRVSRSTWALGAEVTLTVYHDDSTIAENAISQAFSELETVESLMSLYRTDSQLSLLNRNAYLDDPHPYLVEVLQEAKLMSQITKGAFDLTVQPLWKLYSEKAKQDLQPSDAEIKTALKRVDWRRVAISPARIELQGMGTEVTLNGIAQGYASDLVRRSLVNSGIHCALVDTGEIGSIGGPPQKENWTIGIKHPRKTDEFLRLAKLKDRCLATSGDYETRFGESYLTHHLFDPYTGKSPLELSSVSIAAPSAMQADALSTAVFILGLDAGKTLVQATPGVDALFVAKDGSVSTTPGFPSMT
ncbi:ApbE family [Verrucomicrobiia bacterium DG1235]|nr:ApbE family [Verrucomicrobiae bacterium DG1235]